jgi:hypothetical protein
MFGRFSAFSFAFCPSLQIQNPVREDQSNTADNTRQQNNSYQGSFRSTYYEIIIPNFWKIYQP